MTTPQQQDQRYAHTLSIDECKQILPLPDLMAFYGDVKKAKPSACCPFHNDSSPSFGIKQDKDGKWFFNCFAGCGGGDEIAYVAKKENLSNAEATRRYCQLAAEEQKFINAAEHDFTEHVAAAVNGEPGEAEMVKVIEATELLKANIKPPVWVVENLICEGITITGGKPKIGKSWMFMDIALCIASGREALGCYKVNQGEVLYLALEDNAARLQQRLKKLCGNNPPAGLRFITATEGFPRLDKGGMEQLTMLLKKYPKTTCIMVDTLQKVKPVGAGNRNAYENDVDAVGALHKFALTHHVAVVLIHHLRKSGADDPFDELSGSLGLSGTADTNIVIRSNRANGTADLHVTGRAIEEYQELALSFDKTTAKWTVLGTAAEVKGGENRQVIREVVLDAGKALSVKEIKDALEASGNQLKLNNIKITLRRMVTDGQLVKEGLNKYGIGSGYKPTTAVGVGTPHKNSVT